MDLGNTQRFGVESSGRQAFITPGLLREEGELASILWGLAQS